MKIKLQWVLLVTCAALIFSSCGNGGPATEAALSNRETIGEQEERTAASGAATTNYSEEAEEPAGNDTESLTSEMEALLAAAGELQTSVPEDTDGYPTTEEILSILDNGEGKVFWLADDPDIPNACIIPDAESADAEDVWDDIFDAVFVSADITGESNNEGRQIMFDWNSQSWTAEISAKSITLSADSAIENGVLDDLVKAISGYTNMSAAEVDASESDGEKSRYIFAYGGIALDEYGYSTESDVWISESKISVLTDGGILISNPVIVKDSSETIDSDTLVTMDAVKQICETYYTQMAEGVPSVCVITNVELVYYYADGQLLPAWRLTGTQYMSKNGHDLSVLIDAQTGKMIRDV